jgi:predicted metalloendopeptidase
MENEIVYTSTGGGAPAVPPVDRSVRPGSDFYSYVNNRWTRRVHLPAYEDSFGVSEEIELDVRTSLMEVLADLREKKPAHKLSLLTTSFLHTPSQASAILDLQQLLNSFDCIRDAGDVAEAIGRLNALQSSAPISCVVNTDYYDSKVCCVYLYEAQLGLGSKAYYNAEDTEIRSLLNKYVSTLRRIGDLMHVPGLERAAVTESSLLKYMASGGELMNVSFMYNKYTLPELEHEYPAIDWRRLLEAWGLKTAHRKHFLITNKRYFHELNRRLTYTSPTELEDWKAWMRACAALSFIKYMPPPFDDLHYELFDKAQKGVTEKLPQKNLTLSVLMTYAKQDLSRIFVSQLVADGTKKKAQGLVSAVAAATLRRLTGLKWMEPSTKRAAIQKIKGMGFQVAFPDTWVSETESVEILPDRPLKNIFTLATRDTGEMISDLLRNTCKRTERRWKDGAFEVNAYYYPEGNLMVVPAGMLRPPFFDLERSLAWNLGGIGAAIGHEITHGFDADGRNFDAEGNYKDWWSPSDERTYTKMTESVVELFEGQKYMGGKVSGERTLDENLADLGGLSIALEALRPHLPGAVAERKKALCEFFSSYAVSWRQKDRPKKAKHALLMDSHAPPSLRVNLIVRQFAEFYEAFDIKAGDEGWIDPSMRIEFW